MDIKTIIGLYHKEIYKGGSRQTSAVECIRKFCQELELEPGDERTCKKACYELINIARDLPFSDCRSIMQSVYKISMRCKDFPTALRISIFLRNTEYLEDCFTSCLDVAMKYQLCYILGRYGISVTKPKFDKTQQDILLNKGWSRDYLAVARDVILYEKEHGSPNLPLDGDMKQFADALINGLVYAGSCENGPTDEIKNWISVLKNHQKTSAIASLALIWMGNSSGFEHMEKYIREPGVNGMIMGALIGTGVICSHCEVEDSDFHIHILLQFLKNRKVGIGAIIGLALGFSNKSSWHSRTMIDHVNKMSVNAKAFAAVALGSMCTGSCREDLTKKFTRIVADLLTGAVANPVMHLVPVALGLLYLQSQISLKEIEEIAKRIHPRIKRYTAVVLRSCAYAGTGDEATVKHFLSLCEGNYVGTEAGAAVIGISLVSMGTPVRREKTINSLIDLFHCEHSTVRRAVPLALGLLSVSNPQGDVLPILQTMCGDRDTIVAMGAIISLGIMGAGTNNAAVGKVLHDIYPTLSDSLCLFTVCISQGLLHLGKGCLTLCPFDSAGFLLSRKSLVGLVLFFYTCLDLPSTLLGGFSFLLYFLVLAMKPKVLMTLDHTMSPLSVPIKVEPKIGTDSEVQKTPVLLHVGQKAELATDRYIPLSSILEGTVILEENPGWADEID